MSAVPPDDVAMVARTRVSDGHSPYLAEAGQLFWTTPHRGAILTAIDAAELRYPDGDEGAAVAAFADDPEVERFIEVRTLRLIAEAWAGGLRPN